MSVKSPSAIRRSAHACHTKEELEQGHRKTSPGGYEHVECRSVLLCVICQCVVKYLSFKVSSMLNLTTLVLAMSVWEDDMLYQR